MSGHPRAGFTLLEMLVAVALTGLLVLMAAAAFGGVIEARTRVAGARQRLDAEMQGRIWLEVAAGSIDVVSGGFEGAPDSAAFTTWMPRAEGWMDRKRARLHLERDTLWLSAGQLQVAVRTDVASIRLDYLLEPGLHSVFVTNWSSPLTAPQAIRLRVDQRAGGIDTLLLAIGDRG